MRICKGLDFLTAVKIALVSVAVTAVILGGTRVALAEGGSEEVVLYDAADFPEFAGRTQETALKKYIEAIYKGPSFQDEKEETYYEKAPGLKGDDDPGVLSKDTMDSMAALVNYYRYLVGLSPVSCTDDYYYSPLLQKEALAYATSREEPSSSGLKLWSFGYTPLKSVRNWMYQEYIFGNEAFYDRIKIIDPTVSNIYLGYSEKGAVYYHTKRENTTELPFISYPGQGYMPLELFQRFDKDVWMIKLDKEKIRYDDAYGVTVLITDPDEKSYTLTKTENTVMFYDQWFGFTVPERDIINGHLGTYRVEVTGLTDVATGKPAKLCYSTTFFNATEALNTEVTDSSINGAKKLVLPSSMTTEANLNSVAGILPKEITVTAANGRVLRLPAKSEWVADKDNKCFKNSILEDWLPTEVKDETKMLDSVCISYEVSEAPDNISLNFRNLSTSDVTLPPNTNIAYHGLAFSITKPSAGDMENSVLYYSKAGTSPYTMYMDSRIDYSYSSNRFEKKEDGSFEATPYFRSEDDSGSLFAISFTEGEETVYVSDAIYITVLPEGTVPPNTTTPTTPTNPTTPTTPTNPTDPTTPTNPGNSSNTTPSSGGGSTPDKSGDESSGSTDTGKDDGKDDEEDEDEEPVNEVPKVEDMKLKAPAVNKKGNKRTVTLGWKRAKASNNVSGYQVQVATNKKYKNPKTINVAGNKVSCKISGLKKNKTYYIRIRGYKQYTDGGKKKKAYGKWKKQTVRT